MITWKPLGHEEFSSAVWNSPIGPLWVAFTRGALAVSEFGSEAPARVYGRPVTPDPLPRWVSDLYEAAFAGHLDQAIPLVGERLTPLERVLLSTASDIPYGHTASYGTVASWAGYPGRARAAGRAMRHAPVVYLIPTHRVIRADGTAAACQRDPLNDRLRQYEHIDLPRTDRR